MAIENGIFAVSAVLNVLFGITTVVIIMKLRRERDAHMRQLEILYGAYTKTVAKLKNMDTSKEGHMVKRWKRRCRWQSHRLRQSVWC